MVGEVETSSASSYTYLSAKHAGQMERKKEEKRKEEGRGRKGKPSRYMHFWLPPLPNGNPKALAAS